MTATRHTFSDASGVFHADYVSGWDRDFLQNVLDNCQNDGDAAMPNFFCEDFLTFRDGPKCTDEATCDFGDPNLLEKIKAFQPTTPLDVTGTIVAEETQVVGALPRGTCNGSLVVENDSNAPGNPDFPSVLTSTPTPSPTEAENDPEDENDPDDENDSSEENDSNDEPGSNGTPIPTEPTSGCTTNSNVRTRRLKQSKCKTTKKAKRGKATKRRNR